MTIQNSDTARNAALDSLTTTLGAGWKLKLRTGAQPATVATASSGTIFATFTPTASSAATGAKVMVSGAPISVNASAANSASGHYELTTSADVVHERGSLTATGGGGDLTIDNINVASGQAVQITGWTKTAPGA